METFSSTRDAKEYLVAQLLLEAKREQVALSETERKMLYFSETARTLPDVLAVNEAFERQHDTAEYEAKIGMLVRGLRRHLQKNDPEAWRSWEEAIRVLSHEDHYLLALIHTRTTSTDSRVVDRAKLVATALAAIIVMMLVIAFLARR